MTVATTLPPTFAATTPKGGVGKSTTATALGLWLAKQQKRVLMLDQDNLGSLTNNLQGADVRYPELSNITDMFQDPDDGKTIKVSVISEYLHLIQGDSTISDINRSNDLALVTSLRENLLQHVPNISSYDYIIIDTPAGNGNTLLAALICADVIYSPIDLDNNAIGSLAELTKVLKPIRRGLNKNLSWAGFVVNRVQKIIKQDGQRVPEALTDRTIYNDLVKNYGDSAFLGMIGLRNPIKKAISSGQWISGKDESAQEAAIEIESFCKALLEKAQ